MHSGMRAFLVALMISAFGIVGARAADCATDAAALARAESELPKIEVVSPADRPPYCITLETIMAFASRVKAHAARCPQSDHIPTVVEWDNRRTEYSRLFSRYRCKRTR